MADGLLGGGLRRAVVPADRPGTAPGGGVVVRDEVVDRRGLQAAESQRLGVAGDADDGAGSSGAAVAGAGGGDAVRPGGGNSRKIAFYRHANTPNKRIPCRVRCKWCFDPTVQLSGVPGLTRYPQMTYFNLLSPMYVLTYVIKLICGAWPYSALGPWYWFYSDCWSYQVEHNCRPHSSLAQDLGPLWNAAICVLIARWLLWYCEGHGDLHLYKHRASVLRHCKNYLDHTVLYCTVVSVRANRVS